MSIALPVSPLQPIDHHPGKNRGISLFIKRDDLLHPQMEGSKGRKLAAIVPLIQSDYPGGLVTFGGAFSNHLHAVAVAGKLYNFPTMGILRGEYADLENPTLRFCTQQGMQLHRISKGQYDAYKKTNFSELSNLFPNRYVLPEGGNTPQAVAACASITTEILAQLPEAGKAQGLYLCAPAGTGCTAAGMLSGLSGKNGALWIFPVSSHAFDSETILGLLPDRKDLIERFRLIHDYSFGGFARLQLPVMEFVRQFYQETRIKLDPIYTAKMMLGVFDLLAKGAFPDGSTVVVLHTGGLQGWEGFEARYGLAGTPGF